MNSRTDKKWWKQAARLSALLAILAICFYLGSGPTGTAEGAVNADGVSYQLLGGQIILSWGEKPTGGYSIAIEKMTVEGDALSVYYSLKAPADGDVVFQALTYPTARAELDSGLIYSKILLVRVGAVPVKDPSPVIANQMEWTVYLAETIQPATVNGKSVVILNSRGQAVSGFEVATGSGSKTIVVKPPANLVAGTYTVWVEVTGSKVYLPDLA